MKEWDSVSPYFLLCIKMYLFAIRIAHFILKILRCEIPFEMAARNCYTV